MLMTSLKTRFEPEMLLCDVAVVVAINLKSVGSTRNSFRLLSI